jgi:hypothetical protein
MHVVAKAGLEPFPRRVAATRPLPKLLRRLGSSKGDEIAKAGAETCAAGLPYLCPAVAAVAA